jgi:hypothetical protein
MGSRPPSYSPKGTPTGCFAPRNLWGRRGQPSEIHPCRPKHRPTADGSSLLRLAASAGRLSRTSMNCPQRLRHSRCRRVHSPTTTLNLSWPTRTTPTSRRETCARNGCRIGVHCPQPGVVARPGQHHRPCRRVLDSGHGFLVWLTQESGTLRGPADVLSGNSGKHIPIGYT